MLMTTAMLKSRGKRSKISSGFVLGNNGQLATWFYSEENSSENNKAQFIQGRTLQNVYPEKKVAHFVLRNNSDASANNLQGSGGIWIGFAKVYFHTNLGAILYNIQEIFRSNKFPPSPIIQCPGASQRNLDW